MQQGFIWGWDSANSRWVRVKSDSQGRLIIDPSNLFESNPTNGETKKGPDSDWAYDHENNANAHHEKTPPQDLQDVTDAGNSTPNDIQITNFNNYPSGGVGLELHYRTSVNASRVLSYDRVSNVRKELQLDGDPIKLMTGDVNVTDGVYQHQGSSGASGTFDTADGKTVTVSGGIITDIS